MYKYIGTNIFNNSYWLSINYECNKINIINLIKQLHIPVDFEFDLHNMSIIPFNLNCDNLNSLYNTHSHYITSSQYKLKYDPIFDIFKYIDIFNDF